MLFCWFFVVWWCRGFGEFERFVHSGQPFVHLRRYKAFIANGAGLESVLHFYYNTTWAWINIVWSKRCSWLLWFLEHNVLNVKKARSEVGWTERERNVSKWRTWELVGFHFTEWSCVLQCHCGECDTAVQHHKTPVEMEMDCITRHFFPVHVFWLSRNNDEIHHWLISSKYWHTVCI